jgi:membrane protein DedA with SNARE-associated domain
MDTKDKVSVWAGIITLGVLQVEDRVNTELNIYLSDWAGVVGAVIGYAIGFAIVYFITRLVLERYFKRRTQPQPAASSPFGSP